MIQYVLKLSVEIYDLVFGISKSVLVLAQLGV